MNCAQEQTLMLIYFAPSKFLGKYSAGKARVVKTLGIFRCCGNLRSGERKSAKIYCPNKARISCLQTILLLSSFTSADNELTSGVL